MTEMSQRTRKKDGEATELNRGNGAAEPVDVKSFQDSILRLIEVQSLQDQKEREYREQKHARMSEILQREKADTEEHHRVEETHRETLRLEAEVKLQTMRMEELRFQDKLRRDERLAENRRRDTPKMSGMMISILI